MNVALGVILAKSGFGESARLTDALSPIGEAAGVDDPHAVGINPKATTQISPHCVEIPQCAGEGLRFKVLPSMLDENQNPSPDLVVAELEIFQPNGKPMRVGFSGLEPQTLRELCFRIQRAAGPNGVHVDTLSSTFYWASQNGMKLWGVDKEVGSWVQITVNDFPGVFEAIPINSEIQDGEGMVSLCRFPRAKMGNLAGVHFDPYEKLHTSEVRFCAGYDYWINSQIPNIPPHPVSVDEMVAHILRGVSPSTDLYRIMTDPNRLWKAIDMRNIKPDPANPAKVTREKIWALVSVPVSTNDVESDAKKFSGALLFTAIEAPVSLLSDLLGRIVNNFDRGRHVNSIGDVVLALTEGCIASQSIAHRRLEELRKKLRREFDSDPAAPKMNLEQTLSELQDSLIYLGDQAEIIRRGLKGLLAIKNNKRLSALFGGKEASVAVEQISTAQLSASELAYQVQASKQRARNIERDIEKFRERVLTLNSTRSAILSALCIPPALALATCSVVPSWTHGTVLASSVVLSTALITLFVKNRGLRLFFRE